MVRFGLEFYVFSFCLLVYYSGRTVLVFVVHGIPKPKLLFCLLLTFEVCMCVRVFGSWEELILGNCYRLYISPCDGVVWNKIYDLRRCTGCPMFVYSRVGCNDSSHLGWA